MEAMIKKDKDLFQEFIKIASNLNNELDIVPVLYGSLVLQIKSGIDFAPQDICRQHSIAVRDTRSHGSRRKRPRSRGLVCCLGVSSPHPQGFEIVGSKRVDEITIRFNVWLYMDYSGYQPADQHPDPLFIDVVKVGDQWLVNNLPATSIKVNHVNPSSHLPRIRTKT